MIWKNDKNWPFFAFFDKKWLPLDKRWPPRTKSDPLDKKWPLQDKKWPPDKNDEKWLLNWCEFGVFARRTSLCLILESFRVEAYLVINLINICFYLLYWSRQEQSQQLYVLSSDAGSCSVKTITAILRKNWNF